MAWLLLWITAGVGGRTRFAISSGVSLQPAAAYECRQCLALEVLKIVPPEKSQPLSKYLPPKGTQINKRVGK
jgi:hypothetical protein